MFRASRVDINLSQGIAETVETGCVGQQYDVLGRVKVSHDQVARKDFLESVKFMLVLRKSEERSSFVGELT